MRGVNIPYQDVDTALLTKEGDLFDVVSERDGKQESGDQMIVQT